MTRTYLVGDVFARLADIPDGTVSLVACSPPFIALRSYLPDGHPDKHLEIGSEPNPGAFIDTLLALTAEWGRVLAPWGSIAIELGDTYAGSGGAGGDYNEGGLREGQNSFDGSARRDIKNANRGTGNGRGQRTDHERSGRLPHRKPKSMSPNAGTECAAPDRLRTRRQLPGWPQAKSLALIPQAYALSLAYGINVLTGAPSPAGEWLVRNEIVWHRPNPAVGALGDKVRPSTSYITVATKSPKRWYDLTAVRTPLTEPAARHAGTRRHAPERYGERETGGALIEQNQSGAPPLDCWFDEHDVWTITTQPSKLAHYAMWPPKLAERIILMMCPAEFCTVCGEGRRRLERMEYTINRAGGTSGKRRDLGEPDGRTNGTGMVGQPTMSAHPQTLGWSDCGHGSFKPGVVLDPFAGTGTTLCVADLHGRDSIGIDIDERNEALMPARYDECKRALFGTVPELPGQLDMFGEVWA